MSAFDIVILRDGAALSGKVITESFSINTSYATLDFPRKHIIHIHFKNPPQFNRDEVYLNTMDKIKGELTLDSISFRISSTGQKINIKTNKIHTIMFLENVG